MPTARLRRYPDKNASCHADSLARADWSSSKIARRRRAKKNPDNHRAYHAVDGKFAPRANANDHVKDNPRNGQPPRPVVLPEHKRPADNGAHFDQFDRQPTPRRRALPEQPMKTENNAERAHRNINPRKNGHRDWALIGTHSRGFSRAHHSESPGLTSDGWAGDKGGQF